MTNVAMYLRKSRAEELTDTVDETLKRHKVTLLEFAKKNDLAVSEIYEEVVSGESLYTRPQMLKLLADVEHGLYDAVLCMDIDRLGRGSMSDQGVILETLKNSGTKIITPRKVYDLNNDIDETYSEFESFMARQELKVIKRRMQRGIRRTIEDGGYIANAPFGYRRAYIDKRPTLEINEDEAKFVRMMFDLYANQGYGCQRIADTVNALGAKPRRSDQFVRISVMKILKNPTYIGKIVWNQKTQIRKGAKGNAKTKLIYHPREHWTVVKGLQKPIISKDLFEKTQKSISLHTHPPSNTGQVENPLAGLIYCKHCGGLMQRQVIRRGGAYLMCPKRNCIVSSSLPLVEQTVLAELRNKIKSIQVDAHIGTDPLSLKYEEAAKSIEMERQAIEKQLNRLHDFLEQGIYTVNVFLQRQKILDEKLEKLALSEKRFMEKHKPQDLKAQASAIETILSLYESSSPQKRNELLKTVVSKVIYSKQKGAKPNEFKLEFFFVPFYL